MLDPSELMQRMASTDLVLPTVGSELLGTECAQCLEQHVATIRSAHHQRPLRQLVEESPGLLRVDPAHRSGRRRGEWRREHGDIREEATQICVEQPDRPRDRSRQRGVPARAEEARCQQGDAVVEARRHLLSLDGSE
jgi:hypothetical protein